MAQVQIRDEQGNPIPDINIRIAEGQNNSEQAIFDYETDASGNQGWPIPFWPVRDYTLHINKVGVNPKYVAMSVYVPRPTDGLFTDIEVTLPVTLQGQEQGFLRVMGRDFITEDGQPWPFRGYTMHYLINKALEGADLHRILDEPIELGANVVIGIGLHASPWKTANGWRCTPMEHPDYFQGLAHLFDVCAARRIRIAHAPLADVQHMPASFDVQAFWRQSCEVMKGRWNVIARKGNESKHNGWHEADFPYPDMQGVLCSQGSKGGEENPVTPYLDFCEYELRRDLPKTLYDAPLRQLMDGDFAGPATDRPTVSIEPIFFSHTNPDHVGDKRCTDPKVALELGVLTGPCAGGGFGASDGLECKRLQPLARQCAEEYFRGLTAGFVRPLAGHVRDRF